MAKRMAAPEVKAQKTVEVPEDEFARLLRLDKPRERTFMELEEWETNRLYKFAQYAVKGGFSGNHTSVESAYCAILYGLEVGFSPNQSLQNIYTVPGKGGTRKAAMEVEAKAALVVSKGHQPPRKWLEGEELMGSDKQRDVRAICEVERDGVTYRGSFTYGEALAANLTRKDNWAAYWRDMLKWRAEDRAIDDAFPDIVKGLSGAENIDPWEPDGTTKLSIERLRNANDSGISPKEPQESTVSAAESGSISDETPPWAEDSQNSPQEPTGQYSSTPTEQTQPPKISAGESDTYERGAPKSVSGAELPSPVPASPDSMNSSTQTQSNAEIAAGPSTSSQTTTVGTMENKGWLKEDAPSSSNPPATSTNTSTKFSRKPRKSSTPTSETSSTRPEGEQASSQESQDMKLTDHQKTQQNKKQNKELWKRWKDLKLTGKQILDVKREIGEALIYAGMEREKLETAYSLALGKLGKSG